MDTISIGKHNPRLAEIRKAVQRGGLTPDGLLVIDSPTVIHEAEKSGIEIAAVFVREGTPLEGMPRAPAVYSLDLNAFKGIQDTEHSQGVIALVRPPIWSLADILDHAESPVVVLAGLQDPGNVGTILRVADSFGAAGCVGLKGTASVYNGKVVRASAGSLFRVPHTWNLEFDSVVETLKGRKVPMVGTSPHATTPITSWNWNGPVAVLIGNEGAGLSPEQIAASTAMLKIPHAPQAESLNSAIAAAVVLYEAYRRRIPG